MEYIKFIQNFRILIQSDTRNQTVLICNIDSQSHVNNGKNSGLRFVKWVDGWVTERAFFRFLKNQICLKKSPIKRLEDGFGKLRT